MTNKEVQHLENQWKEMNHYLITKNLSKEKHDYVFDRLVWLKKQIDNCKESLNDNPILYYFNETVAFFNDELDLGGEDKFKGL